MFNKKKADPYKIATIVLGIILIFVLSYLLIGKFNQIQFERYQGVYVEGYNKGVEDSVVKLFEETQECKVTTIYIGNNTRQIADLECINQALAQQQS